MPSRPGHRPAPGSPTLWLWVEGETSYFSWLTTRWPETTGFRSGHSQEQKGQCQCPRHSMGQRGSAGQAERASPCPEVRVLITEWTHTPAGAASQGCASGPRQAGSVYLGLLQPSLSIRASRPLQQRWPSSGSQATMSPVSRAGWHQRCSRKGAARERGSSLPHRPHCQSAAPDWRLSVGQALLNAEHTCARSSALPAALPASMMSSFHGRRRELAEATRQAESGRVTSDLAWPRSHTQSPASLPPAPATQHSLPPADPSWGREEGREQLLSWCSLGLGFCSLPRGSGPRALAWKALPEPLLPPL